MKVIPTELAQRISGRPKNGLNVWTFNGGQQVLRKFTQPTNPNSSNQQLARTNFSSVTKEWTEISQAQREAWNTWALLHPVVNNLGLEVKRQGISAYTQLKSLVLMRTGSIGAGSAPANPQPPPPTGHSFALVQLTGNNVVLVINHSITALTNLFVMVKLTPTIVKQSVDPRPQDYRMIEGIAQTSFLPLAASGTSYTFDNTRFPYGDQDLVGVSVQIVTSEGYASLPLRQKHIYTA